MHMETTVIFWVNKETEVSDRPHGNDKFYLSAHIHCRLFLLLSKVRRREKQKNRRQEKLIKKQDSFQWVS